MRLAGDLLMSLGAGTLGAFGADALVNEPVNHAKSLMNIVSETVNSNPEVGSAWNYVFGEKGMAPIEKQSLGNVLTGRGDETDLAILEDTGAMPRIQELMTKRPDLAETVGYLAHMETAVNVQQIDQGIGNSELANAREAYGLPSIAAGVAAGTAGAYGADAAYRGGEALINRFRKKK